jgi:TFIIF-interacting CTD phosphatase-like protein
MNVVLDIDGTLIGEHGSRPFMNELLDYCFKYFNTVSLWSASNKPYIEIVYKKYFSGRKFYLIFDVSRCVKRIKDDKYIMIKPLKKLAKGFYKMNLDDTIIIDDNKISFCRNYGNAIYVPTYKDDDEKDEILKKLIIYLDEIRQYHSEHGTIRTMNKRNWWL